MEHPITPDLRCMAEGALKLSTFSDSKDVSFTFEIINVSKSSQVHELKKKRCPSLDDPKGFLQENSVQDHPSKAKKGPQKVPLHPTRTHHWMSSCQGRHPRVLANIKDGVMVGCRKGFSGILT